MIFNPAKMEGSAVGSASFRNVSIRPALSERKNACSSGSTLEKPATTFTTIGKYAIRAVTMMRGHTL